MYSSSQNGYYCSTFFANVLKICGGSNEKAALTQGRTDHFNATNSTSNQNTIRNSQPKRTFVNFDLRPRPSTLTYRYCGDEHSVQKLLSEHRDKYTYQTDCSTWTMKVVGKNSRTCGCFQVMNVTGRRSNSLDLDGQRAAARFRLTPQSLRQSRSRRDYPHF